MARKTILVSDLSGQEIPDDQYAKVTISNGTSSYVLDVTRSEVADLIAKGQRSKRRGRKAKA